MTRAWLLGLAERLDEAADYAAHMKGRAAAETLRHASRIVTALADDADEPSSADERQSTAEARPDIVDAAGSRLTLSVEEAGQVLGISRGLAYELVARGEIPSIRLGRRVVVPKAALGQKLGFGIEADRPLSA